MREGNYGLGIDIGDDTVTAAVCRKDDGHADPRPLLLTAAEAPRGLMARVGTAVPLYSGGRSVPAAELAAAIVHRVRTAAEAQEAGPPGWTVLAIPASWGAHRSTALARALEAAGDVDVSMVSGALTATYHHVRSGNLPADATVAVYDLGAGTLDTAVVGPGADGGLDHVAVPPRPLEWGGRDVDDVLLAHVLRWSEESGDGTADREHGLALRARTVAAKEALSTETVTALETGSGAPLRVTREELDELIDEDVRASVGSLLATVDAAGRSPEDLRAVVLAGGAVRTPLIGERLSADLDLPLVVGDDPQRTVALGAARLAADTLAGAADGTGRPADSDATPAPDPADAQGTRGTGRTVRRPAGSGRRSVRGPRTRAQAGTELASGRRSARALVVAGMFAALLLVPTMSAVLSTTTGAAPADSVARAGGPADTEVPAPGAGPTPDADEGARVSAAASVGEQGQGTPRSGRSATDGARTTGTTAGSSASTAAGSAAPTDSGTSTDAPVSTAGAPSSAGTPGGSPPPPPSGTTDPPVETSDPPVETTDPPVETTDPPVETTDPPVETTDPPVESTPPADTTPPPAETTAATAGEAG